MEGFKDDQNKSNQQTSLAKKVTGKVKVTTCQYYKKWVYVLIIFGGVINILNFIVSRMLENSPMKVAQVVNNLVV